MVLAIFLITAFSGADCPTRNQMPRDFTPQIIQSFLRINRSVDDPAELICCVARNQNIEIAVAHSSIAAQNSDPQHPRVLIIMKNSNGTIRSVMSVNSEAQNLNQTHSVEYMYNNASASRLEFYDIDFAAPGRRFPMQRNPETCMNCHGSSIQGETNPRTIFDQFPWPRFVDQAPIRDGCPNTQALKTEFSRQSMSALQGDPRYACIKDRPLAGLTQLEHSLGSLNNRRIAKQIRTTADYPKYKYALVASEICDANDSRNPAMNILLPESVIKKLNGTSTVRPALQGVRSIPELANYATLTIEKNRTQSIQLDQKISHRGGSTAAAFRPPTNAEGNCEASIDKIDFTAFLGNNITYNKYLVDSITAGDGSFANFRFLFETRGINISNWGQQATTGYDVAPVNLWVELVKAESQDSALSRLLKQEALDAEKSVFFTKSLQEPSKTRICRELTRLSYEAFGEMPPNTGDIAVPPGVAQ